MSFVNNLEFKNWIEKYHCDTISIKLILFFYGSVLYQLILKKIIKLQEKHPSLLNDVLAKAIMRNAEHNLEHYKHIDFYAPNASEQMTVHLEMMNYYKTALSKLLAFEQGVLEEEINEILVLLINKYQKLARIREKIPQGMLDVKRALILMISSQISAIQSEEQSLRKILTELHQFMNQLNKKFTELMSKSASFKSFLSTMTSMHWQELSLYQKQLIALDKAFQQAKALTVEGMLIKICIENALQHMPSAAKISQAIQRTSVLIPKEFNLASERGQLIGYTLEKQNKPYFYMPSRDDFYHFDYDPTNDLLETGGNCFGESFMFMQALQVGKFKSFCPELALINFQLDQTRKLKFGQETIGRAETAVSATSQYQSVQWHDVQDVFLNNNRFKAGDICGLEFSMNAYTLSKRSFVAGHIAVVAKLDTSLTDYKYIVFEKEFGAFGLADDASLTFVLSQVLMPLYEGMSYSKIKLVKYAEASSATYALLANVKPLGINNNSAESSSSSSFFNGKDKIEPSSVHAPQSPSLHTGI